MMARTSNSAQGRRKQSGAAGAAHLVKGTYPISQANLSVEKQLDNVAEGHSLPPLPPLVKGQQGQLPPCPPVPAPLIRPDNFWFRPTTFVTSRPAWL